MAGKQKNSGRGQRELKASVKNARGRTVSQVKWLQRQLNDPYVKRAKAEGYRGRAAYKIMELDDKFKFLEPGSRVVDLGCAPGGWCQVVSERVNAQGNLKGKHTGQVIGVDLQEVEPIPGVELYQLDFLSHDADAQIKNFLGGKGANLSEMGKMGLPVPPGFTISTEVCKLFYKNKFDMSCDY